jgi:hypothetical protein
VLLDETTEKGYIITGDVDLKWSKKVVITPARRCWSHDHRHVNENINIS